MHHRITYMYISFQQNWVSRSVKIVRTNIFTKNCKLHKFTTILIKLFLKIIYFGHASPYNVHVAYINFQRNRVCRSVITVHTNVFAKKLQVSLICNYQ